MNELEGREIAAVRQTDGHTEGCREGQTEKEA